MSSTPRGTGPAKASGSGRKGRTARITFVTGNAGKVRELQALLAPHGFDVVQDGRGYPEVQAQTLQEVCEAGAESLLQDGLEPPFLLEDSGLFIDSLSGFPGVYSRHAQDTLGNDGILRLLAGVPAPRRGATFRTCLTMAEPGGGLRHFAGVCRGRIATTARGGSGFGFDPIFAPSARPASARTFGEMDEAEKSGFSHRGKAVRRLLAYLAKAANQ